MINDKWGSDENLRLIPVPCRRCLYNAISQIDSITVNASDSVCQVYFAMHTGDGFVKKKNANRTDEKRSSLNIRYTNVYMSFIIQRLLKNDQRFLSKF